MNIAYLTPTYPPYPGGIGMACFYTAQHMSSRGHRVTVFTPTYDGAPRIEDHAGVTTQYLKPLFKYGNAAFLPQLVRLLKEFDVVHCYYPFFGGLEVAAYAKARGATFSLVVHHEMDTVGQGILRAIFKIHEQYLMPWVLTHTDIFAALSHDYLDHSPFAAMLKRPGMPPVAIIPNGVDVSVFQNMARDFPHDPLKLILVAGLDRAHYFKGVSILIEAVRLLKEEGVRCEATIVGEGDMRSEYEDLAQKKMVSDCVYFAGLVTHDELPALLAQHDVFVMPSVATTESFCIAAAEAQSVGLPAIVSDLPGLRQTIGMNETGLVFTPGDTHALAQAIKRFSDDTELWSAYSKAARTRMVERFAWEKVADAALAAYTKSLNG